MPPEASCETASDWRITRSTFSPASFLQVGVAPAAADELGEEVGVLRHVLQADRPFADAVEVAADADVVDARHLADVVDVVGHLGERRLRERLRGLHLLPHALRSPRRR